MVERQRRPTDLVPLAESVLAELVASGRGAPDAEDLRKSVAICLMALNLNPAARLALAGAVDRTLA